ncbi:MAG: hypothetical protein FHK80_19335 [Azoarcus sp. PHD]|nr:MAG: hypothetical protein FHK80_19335 [Azoarcus sp. PHD]
MFVAQASLAHHGWAWATDVEFELTGTITKARLGNPHGELNVAVKDESWVVEVGQPWRNERAGLSDEMLGVGRVITVHGHRSSNPEQRVMKAERIIIDGKSYNLYPDRKS